MANTIKFKRASGSDPSASDLAIGEPGLRTDTAELFFKKDDGTVAKVSGGGGGPNFKYLELRNAANNGAASFPGNDFTLVTAGTTTAISPSAANTLLVSVSGVIQKPNAGTSTSGITGFIIDGSRFKTATNLPAAPDFIVFQESGGIGEPSDNTVTSAKIVDGAIVNADINASAAIAGSKIDPTFTSTVNVTNNLPEIFLTDSNSSNARARLNANGGGLLLGADNDNAHANSSISFEVDGSNKMFIDSSGNVGIGTTSPSSHLEVIGGTGANILLNAATHDASTANQARLQLGFVHSGGQALGHIKLDEGGSNSFDGILRLGVPFNNQSGGSSTREVIEADFNGNICFPGSTTVFDTTSRTNGLQLYYETDSGIATIASHSSGGSTRLDLGTNSGGGAVGIGMTIRETGKVGIGTTSPAAKLHISDTYHFTAAGGNSTTGMQIGNYDGSSYGVLSLRGSTLRFDISNSEKMRIDSSGRLLLGTTTAAGILNAAGTSYFGADSNVKVYALSSNTEARLGAGGISSVSNVPFTFYIANGGSNFEAMRIDTSGSLLIGTTTAGNAHDNGNGIEIGESNGLLIGVVNKQAAVFARHSGQGELLRFQSGNTDVGSIDTSGSGVNYTSGSDYRLKENIVALTDGITRLKTLKPSRFNFISDPDKTVDGFIAHEVTAVPEAVTGTKDEVDSNNKPIYQGIDLGKLVPLLTAALQEAIGRIEALEAK